MLLFSFDLFISCLQTTQKNHSNFLNKMKQMNENYDIPYNLSIGKLRMLNSNKFFTLTRSLACNMIRRQCFSVFFIDDKKFDPAIYDVLIQDIDGQDLHGQISKQLGKPYLSPLKEDQKEYLALRKGIFYGSSRGLITIPTRSKNQKPIWIHYLIDTGAPWSYLSKQALKALKLDETQNKFSVFISGISTPVRQSTAHFSKINLLGMDFLECRKSLHYDMVDKIITLEDHQKEN